MKNIQNKINIAFNNYKPGEFLPVYEGGELINRKQFVKYKLHCVFVKHTLV